MTSARPKPEDSAAGCRAFAQADLDKAAGTPNEHVRATFQRSADAWTARADLLDRLEASFNARAAAIEAERGLKDEGGDHAAPSVNSAGLSGR